MSRFYLRLRELRVSRKLSQQELADLLKISKSSINMYERGEREPGLDLLEAIADFFNVDMDYLMGKSDDPQKYLTGVANSIVLTVDEKRLVNNFRDLNKEGKSKLLDYSDDILEMDKYKKCNKNEMEA